MRNRLVIVADVHVGLEQWDPSPVLERAVERIVALSPQRVVLLGDVVNRGWTQEYDRAKQILRPLAERLEPMLGNHELQRAGVADFESAWGVSAARQVELCGLPALLLNSGIENLPDTQWGGRLDASQLGLLRRAMSRHDGRPVLVFCHHPLTGTVRRSDEPMFGLEDSEQVAQILTHHRGPLAFVSGHTHAHSVVCRPPVTYIGCPALGFWPHALLVMDIDDRQIEFSTVRLIDDPKDSPDAEAADPAYRACCQGAGPDWSGTIELC